MALHRVVDGVVEQVGDLDLEHEADEGQHQRGDEDDPGARGWAGRAAATSWRCRGRPTPAPAGSGPPRVPGRDPIRSLAPAPNPVPAPALAARPAAVSTALGSIARLRDWPPRALIRRGWNRACGDATWSRPGCVHLPSSRGDTTGGAAPSPAPHYRSQRYERG